MSGFLEEVLANPPTPKSRKRPREGLTGSPKRYATLVALMVGLTVAPTWIMLRAGVEGLDSPAAAPARPIVMGVPDQPSTAAHKTPPQTQAEWALPIVPLNPPQPKADPILERKSVVDISPRPSRPSTRKSKQPSKVDNTSKTTKPAAEKPAEPTHKPKRHKKKRTANIERPERPQVERGERPLRTERPQFERSVRTERARS